MSDASGNEIGCSFVATTKYTLLFLIPTSVLAYFDNDEERCSIVPSGRVKTKNSSSNLKSGTSPGPP